MNMSLIEYGENLAAVIDEYNNVYLVQKFNNMYSFKDILLLENEIETLKIKLEEYKNKLLVLKINSNGAHIIDSMIFFASVFVCCAEEIQILEKINLIFLITGLFKGVSCVEFGTKKGRYLQTRELVSLVKQLKVNISKLEYKLSEMKSQTNYCVVSNSLQNADSRYRFEYDSQNSVEVNYHLLDLQYTSNVYVRKLVP